MEVDPPSSENSDQGTGNTPKVRSYGCAFCKRGFSNAQALGGHMNIHRKDRAKLKEPFPITKKNLSSPPLRPLLPVVSTEPRSSLGLESNENKACTLGQAWPIVSAELQQLQLFVDRPSSSEPHKSGSDHERETQMTAYGSWAHEELDLELRLGPES